MRLRSSPLGLQEVVYIPRFIWGRVLLWKVEVELCDESSDEVIDIWNDGV